MRIQNPQLPFETSKMSLGGPSSIPRKERKAVCLSCNCSEFYEIVSSLDHESRSCIQVEVLGHPDLFYQSFEGLVMGFLAYALTWISFLFLGFCVGLLAQEILTLTKE